MLESMHLRPRLHPSYHVLSLALLLSAACSSASTDGAPSDPPMDAGKGPVDTAPDAEPSDPDVTGCGYEGRGEVLELSPELVLCLPPVLCLPETCPPGLGRCVDGKCVYEGDYRGLATMPEAWVTQYCDLSSNGCNGISQLEPPATKAMRIAADKGHPLCNAAGPGDTCVGIMAAPPMMVGNSEVALDPDTNMPAALWGLGLTEATGLCYEITGPGGSALVAITDRCGGYCRCGGSSEYGECGSCVNAADLEVKCPCVGAAPPLYDACCVRGEPVTCGARPEDDALQACDWCASNNHPHFDLDDATFVHVCGPEKDRGSCRLSRARFVRCTSPDPGWPANR